MTFSSVYTKIKKPLIGIAAVAILCAAATAPQWILAIKYHFKESKIKADYVVPSKFSGPKLADLDFDGQLETIIEYEKQTLLFKVSKTYDGKVKLEANPFEISEKK